MEFSKFSKVLKILWGLVCVLMLVVSVNDLMQFSTKPELYPIGWEGGGWSYCSADNYRLTGYISIAWIMIGVLPTAFINRRWSNWLLLIHILASVSYVMHINRYCG